MKIDMLFTTINGRNPQVRKDSKGTEGSKNFADIFNGSLQSTNDTRESRDGIISAKSTPQFTKETSYDNVKDVDEKVEEGEKEVEVTEEVIQQIYAILLQLKDETLTLEEGLTEIQQLLGNVDINLIEGNLKDSLLELKDQLMGLEATTEGFNLEENSVFNDLKELLKDVEETAVQYLETEKSSVDQTVQPQSINQQRTSYEGEVIGEGQYMDLDNETMVTEINLLQMEMEPNKDVKKQEVIEDILVEEIVESPLGIGEVSIEGTKQFNEVVPHLEEENLNLDPKILIAEVASKAKVLVQNGKSEMKIQLMPENLGHLFINITMDKGTLTAKLFAESQQIKEMIDSNLDQLKIALGDKGINISKLEVAVGHNRQDFNRENSFLQQQKNKFKVKRTNSVNGPNGIHSMEYPGEISNGNPYLVDSKFDGLA